MLIRQRLIGVAELFVFVFFTNKGFYNAYACEVLLKDGVQGIRLRLDGHEHGAAVFEGDGHQDDERRDENQENEGEFRMDVHRHGNAADQHKRLAHKHSESHADHLLDLLHILSEACDHGCRGEAVRLRERQSENLFEQGLPQIRAEILGGHAGENRAADAADHADGGRAEHDEAGDPDASQVALRDAFVDDAGHEPRLDEFHGDLHDHEDGGQEDHPFVGLEISVEEF